MTRRSWSHSAGSGIVSSKMLADHMRGDSSELVAQRAAADREWTYGHIVVDEAQELTAMDWRMLIRRCPSRSFTIVGDVAQTSALGGTRDWRTSMNALFGPRNWSLNELTINYRNPREVSDLAARFAEGRVSLKAKGSTSPPSRRSVRCPIRCSA